VTAETVSGRRWGRAFAESRGRLVRRATALVAVLALAGAACSSDSNGNDSGSASDLPQAVQDAMSASGFENARWSLQVAPVGGGDAVYSLDADAISGMGSNMKLYSVGTWVDVYGPDATLETPVYGLGSVSGGTLGGDLVLRASGDLVMGGRNAGSGELGYSVPPQPDANGLPGAKPAPGDPLAGLNDLAEQVAASGVTSIDGDVVIDDRLFETWVTYDVEISPIVINDNLVAVVSTPGSEGEPATLEMIPETSAFTLVDDVETAAAGGDTSVDIEPQLDADGQPTNTLVVSGTIAADSDPLLNVYDVPDPASYARTLFIEALERAGVTTTADPAAVNDATVLPAADTYADDAQLASIDSPPISEIATLIWKISHNYGANLTVCLLAVKEGSTDCDDGFAPIRERTDDLGIEPSDVWMLNGAGADFSSTTPEAMVTWLKWMHSLEWGDQLTEMLPILGTDGSLTLAQTDSPAKGKVQAKTGTWAGVDPGTGALLVPGQALAGFMESDGGDLYAFGLYMNGGTFSDPSAIIDVLDGVAAVAAELQQDL